MKRIETKMSVPRCSLSSNLSCLNHHPFNDALLFVLMQSSTILIRYLTVRCLDIASFHMNHESINDHFCQSILTCFSRSITVAVMFWLLESHLCVNWHVLYGAEFELIYQHFIIAKCKNLEMKIVFSLLFEFTYN